jgi:hypothetical protein
MEMNDGVSELKDALLSLQDGPYGNHCLYRNKRYTELNMTRSSHSVYDFIL